MTDEEKRALEALREVRVHKESAGEEPYDYGHGDLEGVLTGEQPFDISHAGGEFNELRRQLLGDLQRM
jgi:hypothetical protein